MSKFLRIGYRLHRFFFPDFLLFVAVNLGCCQSVTKRMVQNIKFFNICNILPWLNLQGTPTYREYKDHLALCLDGKVAVVASCQVFPGFWKWESECRQGKKVDRFSTLAVFRIRVEIPFIEGTKLKFLPTPELELASENLVEIPFIEGTKLKSYFLRIERVF